MHKSKKLSLRTLFIVISYLALLFPVTSFGGDAWQFPIKIGSDRKEVQGLAGLPDEVSDSGKIEWYYDSGFTIVYDDYGRVAKINFAGANRYSEQTPTEHKILYDITPQSTLSDLIDRFGKPIKIVDESAAFDFAKKPNYKPQILVYTWKKDGFIIEAEIMQYDFNKGERKIRKNQMGFLRLRRGL